jgi:hypothetical protein
MTCPELLFDFEREPVGGWWLEYIGAAHLLLQEFKESHSVLMEFTVPKELARLIKMCLYISYQLV